jgi:hypothetical protein
MGVLETILIAGAVSAAPKLFAWLWKQRGLRKVPKELRGPLEAVATSAAKAAATSAVKQFAKDKLPPPVPSR